MAAPCNVAFGRYLKSLRERRGLSLEQVYARSQSFPEALMKGYLSRVENGHQKLALPKLIPIRIFLIWGAGFVTIGESLIKWQCYIIT